MPDEAFAVGDIHGCYHTFRRALDQIGPGAEAPIIPVGDLPDGGNHSRELIRFCMENKNIQPIRGNHEETYLRYYRGMIEYHALSSTKKKTLKQFKDGNGNGKTSVSFEDAVQYFETFPLYRNIFGVTIVHAGVRYGVPMERQDIRVLLGFNTLNGKNGGRPPSENSGLPGWAKEYPEEAPPVVFGHMSLSHGPTSIWKLPYRENLIPLDTRCVRGGFLTVYRLPDGKYWRIPVDRRDIK